VWARRSRVSGFVSIASAFGSIHDVLHSTAFSVAGNLVVLFAVVLWLGLGFRVLRDARRRIDDGWLVALSALLGFGVPYVGPVVYMLFRPPETLADMRAREIEMRALRERLSHSDPHCPVCLTETEPEYLVCPVCTTRLREPCRQCEAPLEPLWQACPYCATPVTAGTRNGDLTPYAADLDAALSAEAAAANGELAQRRAQRAG
jgi:Double zinc ribbon